MKSTGIYLESAEPPTRGKEAATVKASYLHWQLALRLEGSNNLYKHLQDPSCQRILPFLALADATVAFARLCMCDCWLLQVPGRSHGQSLSFSPSPQS